MSYQLPVPPDRVLQELFVSGQSPPPPQTPSSVYLSPQDSASLQAALITNLQQNASQGKSILRVFMFNLYAQYHYQNQQYHDLFDATVAYYLFLLESRDQNPMQRAVDETVKCEMVLLVQSYPELGQMLNRDQQGDLQQLMALRNDIEMRMSQQYAGSAQQPQQYANPQGQRQGYPIQFGNTGHSGNFNGNQAPGFGFNRGGPAPSQNMNSRPFATAGMRSNAERSMPGHGPVTGRPETGRQRSTEQPATMIPKVSTVSMPTTEESSIMEQLDVKFTRYFKLAHLGEQKLISRKKDGHVEYAITNKNQEIPMDYAQHENSGAMLKLSRSISGGPSLALDTNWNALNESKTVSAEDDMTSSDISKACRIILSDVVAGLTIPHGMVMAEKYLDGANIPDISDRAVETRIDVVRPTIGTVEDMIVLAELHDMATLTALIDRFSDIAGRINSRLWYVIHNRLTAVFNRRLKAGVGATFTVESITDDYEDALECLSKSQSSVNVDRFKERTYNAIINVLRLTDFLDCGECDKDENNNNQALAERFLVMSLPWSSREIDLSFKD